MSRRDWVAWRWFDALLLVVFVAAVVSAGLTVRMSALGEIEGEFCDAPPCETGAGGECGCVPDNPPCRMPCAGCCVGGCKAPPPNPTAAPQ